MLLATISISYDITVFTKYNLSGNLGTTKSDRAKEKKESDRLLNKRAD